MLDGVKHIVLVLSGKGGVGKSTVSTQLALGLKDRGFKVGILDIDLCGPSVPYLLRLEGETVHQCPEGWVPVFADENQRLSVMSIGFLLNNRNDAVIWRGPKKTGLVRQFINDVYWQDLDYLVIDTPPGTSDEHITIMENLKTVKCDGAIVVTTPQAVAIEDVRKEVTFCKKTGIPILGIIENMSGYVCMHCSECVNVFSTGGGESLAEMSKVPFLGRVPLDPKLGTWSESGKNCADVIPDSPVTIAVQAIIDKVIKAVEQNKDESEEQNKEESKE